MNSCSVADSGHLELTSRMNKTMVTRNHTTHTADRVTSVIVTKLSTRVCHVCRAQLPIGQADEDSIDHVDKHSTSWNGAADGCIHS